MSWLQPTIADVEACLFPQEVELLDRRTPDWRDTLDRKITAAVAEARGYFERCQKNVMDARATHVPAAALNHVCTIVVGTLLDRLPKYNPGDKRANQMRAVRDFYRDASECRILAGPPDAGQEKAAASSATMEILCDQGDPTGGRSGMAGL